MAPRTTRPQNLTVYLGVEEVAKPRIARLDALAEQLAIGNRSQLIAMIADGKLEVTYPVKRSR